MGMLTMYYDDGVLYDGPFPVKKVMAITEEEDFDDFAGDNRKRVDK